MNKIFRLPVIAASFLCLLMFSCNNTNQNPGLQTPRFNPLVSAFTNGVISSESSVKVHFSEAFSDSIVPNTLLPDGVFQVSPKLAGNAYYVDQQTIEFKPEEKFESGTDYSFDLNLKKLFPDTETGKSFEFSIQTVKQHLQLELSSFSPYNDYKPENNYVSGKISTLDVADPLKVEAVVTALQGKRELSLSWDHSDDGKEHAFVIDSVARGDEESKVEVSYDGSVIRSDQKGQEEFVIPSLSDFKLLKHKLIQYPEQHVILTFSDPLMKKQDFEGLAYFGSVVSTNYYVKGNTLELYPVVRLSGLEDVHIYPGIKNTAGKSLKTETSLEINFEEIKPAVELLGNGVIVPSTNEVLLPFKAVNLKAVDVKVIQIYEDNIAQFLQVNQLSGDNELKRAGRLILKKSVELVSDKSIDYGQWNTFSLNLTDLIKTEPGAIYRVELNFRKSQSMFPCEGGDEDSEEVEEEDFDNFEVEEMSYWDSYESYYSDWDYYYYEGYQWEDREDPCTPAYYGNRRAVARNVLASNLGLMVKRGSNESLNVVVTDLLNGGPKANAAIKVYNYQNQILGEGATDGQGIANIELKSKPFLVVAEADGQKGYLKLVDGSALSYSMFDVRGNVVKKGLKGYLYGDRGVWRPGDSIFVNLILDDHDNPLPDGHPVSFELKNPQGKVVQRNVVADNGTGFFCFHTKTEMEAPTGTYSLIAKAGGVSYSKMLRIETVKPNKLKIDLRFDSDTLYPKNGYITGKLVGKWLTGAKAQNLFSTIEVMFAPVATTFKGYETYTFTNPQNEVHSYSSRFFAAGLDNNGVAKFSKNLNIHGTAPGMLNAVFTTKIFEKSGDFSIDQKVVKCSPYDTYVGIKTPPGDKRNFLLTDTTHTIKVVTLGADGKPKTRIGLEVNVYKLSWRWWWDASSESTASYMGSSYKDPVFSTFMSTKNGEGSFSFRIDYPEWGRYLVKVKDSRGHSAAKIVYIDWPGYAGRAKKGDPDAASVLNFSTDKQKYNVGETAEITIPSAQEGRILVSIENGSGILEQQWIESSGSETKYSLKLTKEMTPNVYVYASLIQKYENTTNDLPIRMFGVIPVQVEDPDTRLFPKLKMPDELEPNSTVKIQVSEKNGKDMTYTIAMVDEGILDLTRFKTPDPWASFYSKEALGVKTWDMFEYVLGAYGGRIDGIYSIGGGEFEAGEDAKKANRFPPMVRFIGPFTLKGKSNTHTITIPNYIGSVRTMVVAGNGQAFGNTEKTTPVKQPLMVLATLPRVLGPGETVNLPVTVFAMDKKVKNVDIKVSCNEMLIGDELEKRISFEDIGDQVVNFQLKTPEKTGLATVKVVASSGGQKSEYEIELDVRSSNPPVNNYLTAAVEASESYEGEIEYIGMEGTNELLLEVSSIPPVDFGRRLKYLLKYPHGCIEQTTSAAFPQLYLADIIDAGDEVKKKSEGNVKKAISRLSSFQLSDGSFSYWPGRSSTSDWGTSYAIHFLLEAKEKGYAVPQALLSNGLKYQKKAARRWSRANGNEGYKGEETLQAYRLFTLALAGKAEMGAMNRMREGATLRSEIVWRLAAAYALAGQKETAKEMTQGVIPEAGEYVNPGFTYGSRLRDQAMLLEAMVLMDDKQNGMMLLEEIAKNLSSSHWYSTQTTAYCLLAISKFAEGNLTNEKLKFEFAFDGGEMKKAETGLALAQVNLEPGDKTTGKISFKNTSKGMLFVRLVNTGLPKPGTEKELSQGLRWKVKYYDLNNNSIDPATIKQGTDFKVQYSVSSPGVPRENLALTAIYPSGWEINNERMFSSGASNSSFTYQDVRDDRVMTYFALGSRDVKAFEVRLNATYEGKYYLPAVKIEDMYDNRVQVVIPGKWIEVKGQ